MERCPTLLGERAFYVSFPRSLTHQVPAEGGADTGTLETAFITLSITNRTQSQYKKTEQEVGAGNDTKYALGTRSFQGLQLVTWKKPVRIVKIFSLITIISLKLYKVHSILKGREEASLAWKHHLLIPTKEAQLGWEGGGLVVKNKNVDGLKTRPPPHQEAG